jgi:sterol desaturase/sphingolipid hydroxylase (fatty acid hydroxylase superfamily)
VRLALIGCLAGAALLAAGHFRPRVRQPLLRDGFAADLAHAIVNGVLLDLPLALALRAVAGGLEDVLGARGHQPLTDAPLWQQALVFLFLGDLLKWSIHVLHHRVPFLWRLHQVHHSTRQMDALSHARSHPVEFLLNRVPFLVLFVVVLGIDARVIAWYSAIDLVQGLWVHSNTRLRTGPLKFLIATQEFHHWHHANDPAAIDRNFGGFLSIWDWLSGTAYCPSSREVPGFGITGVEPSPRYSDHLMMPLGPSRPARWNFDGTTSSNSGGGA